ncbi:helix-turn-helix domain-containing protein [Nocardioides sp. QY071]|uniref:TetR/AcrR family transcriptional regulator n=1 Tax=Nocardioides sp. QY071 TaxID=3044187 RepID=UPI00249BC69D|nr:helix-turn-helix domain-containing protein [Nocardioides sp. QY071]WGY00396.1 helix-turn-helix domain-containing protein [Nocardioides sp. QY071]
MTRETTTPPPRRTGRRTDRRAEVVAAAAALFRQHGYPQVGIDEIGDAVGFSGPAVYRYFASKADLLEAVVAGHLDRLEATSAPVADRATAVAGLIEVALRSPDGLVTASRQAEHLSPAAALALDARRRDLGPAWAALVPSVAAASERDSADELRARCAAGIVTHVALARPGTLPVKRRLLTGALHGVLDSAVSLSATSRPPLERPLAHATRREAVLAAATELMAARGFAAVSLNDIGAATGITASAVMRHFASKEELLGAAVNRVGEQVAGGLSIAIRGACDAEDALRRIVRTYVALATDHRDVLVIQTLDAAALPPRHEEERRRRHRMYVDELAHVIARARPSLSEAEARLRAGMTYAMVNEVVLSPTMLAHEGLVDDLVVLATLVASGDSAVS